MRTKFAFLSALFLLFVGQVIFAQVTGTASDDFGPLADAEVTVRGGDASAITDDSGKFTIDAKIGDVLIVTDGMGLSQDFKVNRMNMGSLKMGMGIQMEEVLITGGYDRTTTRKESMGAETVISEETFENRATSSFLNSLQGHAPGVAIQSNSGSPGSAQIDVLIRGYGSINASTDPLIVVDGIVIGSAQFRNLNQQDFESVAILRDAHATAIYGNRGSNGVIVITTKRGKAGVPLSIEFSSMYGVFTLPENDYNSANAVEILTLQKMRGLGFGNTLTDEEIANWDGPNTNWRDVFFRTGINQQYNLSMRQGSDNFRSYYSVGYTDVTGMIETTDFKRFTARANLAGNSDNKRFNYEGILSVAYSKRNELDSETNAGISNNVIQNPLFGSVLGMPYLDPNLYGSGRDLFNAIGTNFAGGNYAYVLQSILFPGEMPNRRTESSVLASFAASYEIADGLTLRNKSGIDYKHSQRTFARAPWSFLALAVVDGTDILPGIEDQNNVQDATISNVVSLNYDMNFGLHRLQLGAYAEYVKAHYRANSMRQTGLIESTWQFGTGNGWAPRDGDLYVPQISASYIDAGSFSYFGTLDYEYDQRYGVGATLRRDAVSKFRADMKWGTFWSAAARWVISEEDFLKGSKSVNLLKLRGSYGITGNAILSQPGYGSNPLFLDNTLAWDYYTTGAGYQNTTAYYPVVGNIDIGWEETHQANIGLDFILFNRRLEGNLDVYKKNTRKLFTEINLSAITGQYEIDGNNGDLENKGIELALRYKMIQSQDFNMSIWANASYNENKIVQLDNPLLNPGGPSLAQGQMAYEQYLIPYAGINPDNGEYLYYDFEGNIVGFEGIDPERDSRWTGKSFLPKWVGGFGLSADYKGFYVDANFSFQADYYKFDNLFFWLQDPGSMNDMNMTADLLDAWTPENPNGSMASLTANTVFDGSSDRMMQDASFVRFRSATLGYNFPTKMLEGSFIKGLNIFVQGENLAIWTKWRGFDPEGIKSFSLGQYPNPRSFSFGVNVEF